MTQYQNKKLSLIAILTAISIVLGFFENFFPIPIPGVKLGLSNLGIMISLYLLNFKYTLLIALLKSILIPIITGNLIVKITIGLPATLLAFLGMFVYSKLTKHLSSPISTGALGAFIHISSQFIIIKHLFIKNLAFFKIFPYFSIISIFTGILTGLITYKVIKTINDLR